MGSAYELRLQLFSLARGVPALACYFCDPLCISAGLAAISLPLCRCTVARWMGAFSCCDHGILLICREEAVRKGMWDSVRGVVVSAETNSYLHTSNSMAPIQTTICAVLLTLGTTAELCLTVCANSVLSEVGIFQFWLLLEYFFRNSSEELPAFCRRPSLSPFQYLVEEGAHGFAGLYGSDLRRGNRPRLKACSLAVETVEESPSQPFPLRSD
jgi:hypothetical protein